jgi:hypothetical protein
MHRRSAWDAVHSLQQRRCELSRLALEQAFDRVSHLFPNSPPGQRDEIVQTSFSESSDCTRSEASGDSDARSLSSESPIASDGGALSPTADFPKPDL